VVPAAGPSADSTPAHSTPADSAAGDSTARDAAKDDKKRAGADQPGPEAGRAGRDRDAAGRDRDAAGRDRDAAGRDRDAAGRDRDAAGRDRDAAGRDRDAAGRDRDAAGRDRDAAGRARNARPRDGLGRPLDRGRPGEPTMPEGVVLAPSAALDSAQDLLDAGRPFHAHEVLEASWKSAPAAERDLWQGLAQLAVGLTHARRGNPAGAAAMLRRGAARVSGYAPASPRGVDAAGVAAAANRLAARIERTGLTGLTESDLALRLRP
jgi:hypothetical protein